MGALREERIRGVERATKKKGDQYRKWKRDERQESRWIRGNGEVRGVRRQLQAMRGSVDQAWPFTAEYTARAEENDSGRTRERENVIAGTERDSDARKREREERRETERDRKREREREIGIETGTKKTRGSEGSERKKMKRWRERKRDDLLRRGPRLALLVAPAVLRPPPPPQSPSAFPQPTLDAYTVASPPRPSPTLSPSVPLYHPPLHDPPGCDYLLPLFPVRPFPHPSYLPYDASAATRRRTRTLGAPLLLAADAKAAQRCIWRDAKEVVPPNQASLQRATGKLP